MICRNFLYFIHVDTQVRADKACGTRETEVSKLNVDSSIDDKTNKCFPALRRTARAARSAARTSNIAIPRVAAPLAY